MSQILSFGIGGGGSGSIDTLTGNSGGAVHPAGVPTNINIVGNGTLTVVGNPATHTLTIFDTSKIIATLTTLNANPTTLFSYPMGIDSAVTLNVTVIAADAPFGEAASAMVIAGARRAGAGPTLIGLPNINISQDFAPAIAVNALISGNNLIVQVTGVLATTINWKALVSIVALP